MMGYLIDTDISIDVLKGRHRGTVAIAAMSQHPAFLSAITVGELVHGLSGREASARGWNQFERFLSTVGVLAFDEAIARVYGRLRSSLHSAGRRIDDPDLMIAATAIFHDLTLMTGNARHFERVEGIRITSI